MIEWVKQLDPSIALAIITFIPALELRASIPYGIVRGYGWPYVVAVCIVTHIILGMLVFLFLAKFLHLFLRWRWFARVYDYYVTRTQRKIQKPVERWGELGIAMFIGVPLPGSGVYTGALAAYILGLSWRKFVVANIIGVLIAGTAVTVICLFFRESAGWLIKMI